MAVKKGEPKQKIDARKNRLAGIKEIDRKRKAREKQGAAAKKKLKQDAKKVLGFAKKAVKPARRLAKKVDGAAIKVVKGLFSFR
jgi:hypothetical protein